VKQFEEIHSRHYYANNRRFSGSVSYYNPPRFQLYRIKFTTAMTLR